MSWEHLLVKMGRDGVLMSDWSFGYLCPSSLSFDKCPGIMQDDGGEAEIARNMCENCLVSLRLFCNS
jgi:hypothetical protein